MAFSLNYLYSTEIYPTEIRQIGLGVNSAVSRIGSMLSPFIKELNECTHVSVSMALFSFIALVNSVLVILLPETRGKDIPDTIDQIENQARNNNLNNNRSFMRRSVSRFIKSVYGDKKRTTNSSQAVTTTTTTTDENIEK